MLNLYSISLKINIESTALGTNQKLFEDLEIARLHIHTTETFTNLISLLDETAIPYNEALFVLLMRAGIFIYVDRISKFLLS